MDEIARLMEWDLQAIAGCTIVMDNPAAHLSFSHFCSEQHDHLLWNFHEFSETTTVVNELEELYKPFYPVGSNSIITSSQPVPELKTKEVKDKVIVQNLQDPAASKCKTSKKKEKNKRVEHVTGEDGVWDQWAWRKYGQKPIKRSTYPRSYYRCSSSKGCFARKQVERSHLDHSVFIVTYTAEHSHPHPTRKNSQARNTAKKNRSTSVLLSPGTSVPVVVDSIAHEHAPSVELEQGKGAKKEKGNSWTLYGQE